VYGETPFSLYEAMGLATRIGPGDRFLELGSGRGKGLFYTAERFGCEAMGVEKIPTFVSITAQLALESSLPVQVELGDYISASWPKAHTIYLYGTCLTDSQIKALCTRFEKRPDWIFTTSYPLTDYSPSFHVDKIISCTYPWGKTELYCQRSRLYYPDAE